MSLSFKSLFFKIATVFAFFAILILAKPILIPLAFALLSSFILYPVAKKFESWGMNTMFAAFLSIFVVILIFGGGIALFSSQIIALSDEFSNFQGKIVGVLTEVTLYINKNLSFVPNLERDELLNQIKEWLSNSSGSLVKQTFSSTAVFVTGLMLTVIYTFLILIYRSGFVNALIQFHTDDKKERVVKMFKSVQQVGQKYLSGITLIILILGIINSIGLLIIGIDNPFLFGFLAAILAIIPYIGTIVGAAIPVLYAFLSYDSPWMAIAVAILFWAIQVTESNFLSPKIVGGSVKINALTAILSIIIGSSVWGIAGMILFLPFVAMFKVVCEEYDELKPIALLIGDQGTKESGGGVKKVRSWFSKIKGWFSK